MIYFLIFLDGNKEEYIMATEKHFLILDDIMVICKEETYYYHTIKDAQSLEDVWEKVSVDIVDPYGAPHKLSGFIPNNWRVDKDEDNGYSPIKGYRYPKYRGTSMPDDSVWDHFISYTFGDDYPKEIRVFRTVYELEGGEMPILYHTTQNNYAW